MKVLHNSIETIAGLRFVVNSLELASSPGRQALLETSWTSSRENILQRLEKVTRFYKYLEDEQSSKGLQELHLLLQDVRNIAGSIALLKERHGSCSDVDFYELKCLALVAAKVNRLAELHALQLEDMPSLEAPLSILDIDGERLPSFFISDGYSVTLAQQRKEIEKAQTDEERDRLAMAAAQEEDRVRRRLTKELAPYADDFSRVLGALAMDDLLLAKARWAYEHHYCCPTPLSADLETDFRDLIHPEVSAKLTERGEHFQPVSIRFGAYPTLITGANMAGKSVLLSAITLAQALMQYGFYVPAREAKIAVVDDIISSVGDGQNFNEGLSSFGAEVLRLNNIVQAIKAGSVLLVPIDEPARTTNPDEGCALVDALVQLFAKYHVRSVITTHYSGISTPCCRYRVRGFIEERLQLPLEVNKLNKYIDYSLIKDSSDTAPHEAVRIAEILGIDKELLQYCKEKLNL